MGQTALYVRQSEDKTGLEAAVQRQEADCRMFAMAKGWDAPQLYADNSISATSGKTRPQFEQLIRDIESGAVDRLVVWHLDRLTRSMRDLTRVVEAGQLHRVNIACVHGVSLDLGDPTGVAVAQILTAIAGMETSHKGNRQKAANRQRAVAGKAFWTRRPFGYDRDNHGVHVVPAEAELIREAAASILAGATLSSVVRVWDALGFKTTERKNPDGTVKTPGGKWGVTQLRRLLMNPRYAGKRLYNGEDMGAGDWEPILTAEVHGQLETLLNDPRRRTAPDDMNSKYLLSGIARCGKCERAMFASPVRSGGVRQMVYRCFGGYCLQRRMDQVNAVVEGVVIGLLSRPDAAGLFTSLEDTTALKAQAVDLRGRRDALAALLADGLLSPASVRAQSGKITAELHRVQDAVSAAEGINPAASVIGAPDVTEAWEVLPLPSKKQIIRTLMDVTILPAGKGVRFSPDQVLTTPKQ